MKRRGGEKNKLLYEGGVRKRSYEARGGTGEKYKTNSEGRRERGIKAKEIYSVGARKKSQPT